MYKTFATVINCMDGRIQESVIEYIKEKYSVNYVDNITEAGPCSIVAKNDDLFVIENIKKRVEISINIHGSKFIAITGHHDCAGVGNISKEEHQKLIKKSVEHLKEWNYNIDIIGLWIDSDWTVSCI